MSSYVKLGQHCWTLVIAGKPFLEPVVRAVVVGGNRRKRSSFLDHLLGGLTARLCPKDLRLFLLFPDELVVFSGALKD
ncbi:hypothetical protein C7R92_10025 [Brevibacillus porteri]|uniref:Uncharacterized protein n=1 Tax=Brevibacillus porteri TaxID=2126350 RepID=A0ABX5FSG1_9BACL|nr:hypothetical protein C7R92_10025 [Brevibacillus porteri]